MKLLNICTSKIILRGDFISESNEYLKWVDIAKGIAIIAVVFGHSGESNLIHYIYWFHMPLFFIISGYLFEPIKTTKQLPSLVKKYSVRLLIPYFSFLIVITIIRYVFRFVDGTLDLQWVLNNIGDLFIGGREIGGLYGPFWFITTLFFTYISFTAIQLFIKKDLGRLILIGILYLIAHIVSWLSISYTFIVPLNLDVVLIAISYFAFGYYAKQILNNIPKSLFITSTLITGTLYISSLLGLFDFSLSMKNLGYHNLLLDFIIPVTITIMIIGLAQRISNYKTSGILVYLGKISLPIMYLHVLPNRVLQPILGYNSFTYTLIGLVFSILSTHFFLDRFKLTKMLFLGKYLDL